MNNGIVNGVDVESSKRSANRMRFIEGFAFGSGLTIGVARKEWPSFAADGFMDEAKRIEFEERGWQAGCDAGREWLGVN